MQLYYLGILIFILLFTCQIILGIYSYVYKAKLPKRYSFFLSDMSEPVDTLEKYMKIYRKVNLKVNAKLKDPAKAQEEFILLNKELIYRPDLYVNFFIIFQLELTKKVNKFVREAKPIQITLFFIELISFMIALGLQDTIYGQIAILVTTVAQITVILLTVFIMILLQYVIDESLEIAIDLLNLDTVETARAESLARDLKYNVFEYPLESFKVLTQFILP